MIAEALCAAALALGHAGSPVVARATCERVAMSAEAHGVPVALAVALAWHESRFNPWAVSRAGAFGAMQTMPLILRTYGPDPIGAGVEHLADLLTRHVPTRAVCHYNGGRTCGPRSLRWAGAVVRLTKNIQNADDVAGSDVQ